MGRARAAVGREKGGGGGEGGPWGEGGRGRGETSARFSVLFLNACSLKHNIWELQEYIEASETRPTIICVNETFNNNSVSNAQIAIQGYELIARRDGKDTVGGRCRGLVIYSEEGLGAVQTKHRGEEEVVEVATVEVSWGGGRKLTICQVYRKQNYVPNTLKLLEYLSRLPDQTVTVGDFNFLTISWDEGRGGSEEERKFLQLLEERGWEQRVRGVARPQGGQHPGPGNRAGRNTGGV